MENQNSKYPEREVWNDVLENGEYQGKFIKYYFQPARQAGWSNSYRLLFIIEGLNINGQEYIAFVNEFINERYKSGDKTAKTLQALGCEQLTGQVNEETLDGLLKATCRLYLEEGKEYFSQKLGRNMKNMKIIAINPANRVVPSVVQAPVQQTPVQQHKPFIQQTPAPRAAQPTQAVPAQFATAQATQQGAWKSNGTPMSVSNASALVSKPVVSVPPATYQQPVQQQAPAQQPQVQVPFVQQVQQPVAQPQMQSAFVAPQAQQPIGQAVVEQPLPTGNYTVEELDF